MRRCTVTSSADVGSSAISSFGRQARPMAMSTRWRMPPENSWGYWWIRLAGSAMPTMSSSSMAARVAADPDARPCTSSASAIWSPTRTSGSRFDIGSWGTRPISFPRMVRSHDSSAPTRLRPSNHTSPPSMRPFDGSSWLIAAAVVVLPEPDSPTMASVRPRWTSSDTSRTAGAQPPAVRNDTVRSRIASNGDVVSVTTAP